MTTSRRLSKQMKYFVESKIQFFCPDRVFYYNFKPGFIYPARNNKIIQLPNKVHLYLWHYFPDYNQWLFNYILNREIYLVMDELNHRRTTFCFTIFKNKKIKYLKLMNGSIIGLYLNGLAACAERICFKNVVFMQICKETVKTECKYLTMKSCSNVQHLEHTKFINCEQANLVRCEIMRDNLKVFGENLKVLAIRRTFSVDNIVAKYLAFDSPFKNLRSLDLSYNQIEFQGLVNLINKGCVFANSLERMTLERNLIISSLMQIISRLQLPKIQYIDLNLNQIEWEEDEIRSYHYKIVRKIREKKLVGDKVQKIRSVEIALTEDLTIKSKSVSYNTTLLNPEELFKKYKVKEFLDPGKNLLKIPMFLHAISSYLPMRHSMVKHMQLSRDLKLKIDQYKDKISLKRDLQIKTQYFNHSFIKFMKKKNFIMNFNNITVVIYPNTDKDYLLKISEFYTKFKDSKVRFCLEMFSIDDNKVDHLSIFDYIKPLPQVTQVKCKNCQLITKKVFYMIFWKAKMIYIQDSQFKFWTWKPLHAEQFIIKRTTIWGRANIAQGMLGKCRRFEIVESFTNYLDLILKPFSNSNLREYVVKRSEVHRRGILDPLYSVSWFQTRHRFKHLTLIDIEGVISEANLISLVVYLDYFQSLTLIKIEVNHHNSFDMKFIVEQDEVIKTNIFQDFKVLELDQRMRKFVSKGRFKTERMLRNFDIKYLAKEESSEINLLNGQQSMVSMENKQYTMNTMDTGNFTYL
ncbi:UNKNOWN [Stylonychia lemnae]|uniref:Uncharacterized protein n=1 Tax=Stylonychia lemnae TaxID=5949 RepID=A0A078A4S0_STYLE|nr:UNKNOWN [Stylonychia lemnae]|eukprot:CDW75764.1 UNKNOWN [Stylonychia lemnae]